MGTGADSVIALFSDARHPLADSAFADIEGFGNLVVCPPVSSKLKRSPATLFFPVWAVGSL
jgi:hypothetical protein